jgi:ABC-2 type transport system permease protein
VAWRPRPASWPWLLAHEARLLWRMSGGGRLFIFIVLAGLLFLAFHLAGWFVMRHFDLEAVLRAHSAMVVFGTLFTLLVALSSAFGLAVNALFSRGDIDLLLSSPVPVRSVYVVRGIAVGLASVVTVMLFAMPFADMGPFHGRWGSLAAYPVIASLGLLCAGLAFAATLALVRLLGARRAHVTAQVAGALIGAAIILAFQFETLLPRSTQAAVRAWLQSEEAASWFGPDSVLTWPFRALFGDPLPAIATIALGVGVFAMVVLSTTSGFAGAVQENPVGSAPASRARARARRPFASGLARIVIAKELKLIARDPALIAKSLVNLLYFIPLMLILVRHSTLATILASSLVVLASSLAGTLAWITVSGEEAADLVDSAPVSSERVRWLKIAAALTPVVVVTLPFLAWYAMTSLRLFVLVTIFLALSLASSAVIQVWTGVPGRGRDLRVRQKQNVLVNVVEALSSFGWALACFLAISGYYEATAAGGLLGLVGPVTAWFAGRARRGA